MKSFTIKGYAFQIPHILKAMIENEEHPTILEQVEILEENEVIETEQADREFANYYNGKGI